MKLINKFIIFIAMYSLGFSQIKDSVLVYTNISNRYNAKSIEIIPLTKL
ncbi:MAG: hypothetical protein ACRCR9_01760 [Chitinophagaceae bacterium]